MEKDLIGGVVMFRDNSFISHLVRFGGFFQKGHKRHKWSHVEPIYEKDGELHLLSVVAPRVKSNPMWDYLENTHKDYQIFTLKGIHRVKIDEQALTAACESFIGRKYNYLGALFAGLDKPIDFKTKTALHCSHVTAKVLQIAGALNPWIPAREFAPDDITNQNLFEE